MMKVFISHASKDKDVVLHFAHLLETISGDINVFCSSQAGSIRVGADFTEVILNELKDSDLFVPIVSDSYYDSHFAMVELGIACSYLFEKYKKSGESYIYPFSLFPVKKSYALSGTPIANLQVGDLNVKGDLKNFLDILVERNKIHLVANINFKIDSFVFTIDQILLQKHDILSEARIGVYFDDNISYREKKDVIQYSSSNGEITVNFNMNPYKTENASLPNFISLALRYIDTINFARYLDFNPMSSLVFILTSFTNSIKKIVVEFKYVDGNKILDTFEKEIKYGDNHVIVPLAKMKSEALSSISEVCFVLHPEDVVETEGMFKISNVHIEFSQNGY